MNATGKHQSQFVIKAFMCILGIVVLVFIAMSYKNHVIREGKEPFLTVKEMKPLVLAFSEVEQMVGYEEFWKEKEAEEYVTVKEVKDFLVFFPKVEADILQEYKKDTWYIGVEDFNKILKELTEVYGRGEIVLCDMALMGDKTTVKDETGQSLLDGEILTDQGVRRGVYWNIAEYMYSSVRAVCKGSDILSVIEQIQPLDKRNVYLAEISDNEYHFFADGYHIFYSDSDLNTMWTEEILNEEISNGVICDLFYDNRKVMAKAKEVQYINGKLLQITENGVEIEGYGIFMPDEEMKVYRLYGELVSKEKKDLRIGYDFTDFVLEKDRIVACLMVKDEDMKHIRVLLKNTDYASKYHEEFFAKCNQDYEVIYYDNGKEIAKEEKKAGEEFTITKEDTDGRRLRMKLVPKVLSAFIQVDSIRRSQGTPIYKGNLEITADEEGLLIVNEVLLEDYLCTVVPSEMPASYPVEALMAQAVCARTYAYGKMIHAGLPAFGAHVDDSTGFQVYNNMKEQSSTTQAVKATHNRIVCYQEEPIGTYYYSTSCGVGTDSFVWHGTEENPAYLIPRVISKDLDATEEVKIEEFETKGTEKKAAESKESGANLEFEENNGEGKKSDTIVSLTEEEHFREWIENTDMSHFEAEEGWYRWSYDVEEVDVSHMEEVLRNRYDANPSRILTQNAKGEFESKEISGLGELKDIRIVKRLSGGVADELIITGSDAVVKVISELNIRYVLSDGKTKVLRQSGDYVKASATLPSAFLVLDVKKEEDKVVGYSLKGGGFGHGVGMSQNGAKNMAENGMTHEQILTFFYPGTKIKTLQFED